MAIISIGLQKNWVLRLTTRNSEDGYDKNIMPLMCIYLLGVSVGEKIKGNCDAELVLKTVSDFYTKSFDSCFLITGDGDFGCLVEFLKENKVISGVISPDEHKCSILIRNKNIEITFLNDLYHKFSNRT